MRGREWLLYLHLQSEYLVPSVAGPQMLSTGMPLLFQITYEIPAAVHVVNCILGSSPRVVDWLFHYVLQVLYHDRLDRCTLTTNVCDTKFLQRFLDRESFCFRFGLVGRTCSYLELMLRLHWCSSSFCWAVSAGASGAELVFQQVLLLLEQIEGASAGAALDLNCNIGWAP